MPYDLLILKPNGRRRVVKNWADEGESYRDYLKPGESVIASCPPRSYPIGVLLRGSRIFEPGDLGWGKRP